MYAAIDYKEFFLIFSYIKAEPSFSHTLSLSRSLSLYLSLLSFVEMCQQVFKPQPVIYIYGVHGPILLVLVVFFSISLTASVAIKAETIKPATATILENK